jgi:hypothetical protein
MSDNKKAKTQNKRKPQNKTVKRMSINEKGEPVDLDEVVIPDPSLSELLDREKNMEARLSDIKVKIAEKKANNDKDVLDFGLKLNIDRSDLENELTNLRMHIRSKTEQHKKQLKAIEERDEKKEKGKKLLIINNEPSSSTFSSLPELPPPLSPQSEPEEIKEAKKPILVIDDLTTSSSVPPVKKTLVINNDSSSDQSSSSEKQNKDELMHSIFGTTTSSQPPVKPHVTINNDSSSSSSEVPPTSSSNNLVPSTSSQPIDFDLSKEDLQKEYESIDCKDEKFYSKDCNKFLLKKEYVEREYLAEHSEENPYLYPNLNDKEFNIKIATKKEFNDTKYDGTVYEEIKEHADILAKADFELQPHQAFVKNFMSFQTPYSSLLLYHGLGSGKTLSAIGVCEEMRDYMKQTGITKRIIIVASENVQDNFKLQLFDERKLKQVDGIWTIKGGLGNKLLKEINPMNMKGIPREKVVSQIKNLINSYYIFLGYIQFANYIIKTMNYEDEVKRQGFKRRSENPVGEKTRIQMLKETKVELNSRIIKRLRNEFNNRLVVIDEVHNIRKTDENENSKKVAVNLELLVKAAQNMRFLLLSATPMYNNYKEIIWLLNLMNTNDRRARIEVKDIFDKKGDFKKNGEELLIRKATGYISFVRGENPYTFPYRVYPSEFAKEHTFPAIKYPSYQMNLVKIKHEDKKRVLSLYLTKVDECENCGKCQFCVYKYIIHNLRNKKFLLTTKTGDVREMPNFQNMESFGYDKLQIPLESLIISYPIHGLKAELDEMPTEKLSEELAPSFSESIVEEEEEEDEKPVLEDVEEPVEQEEEPEEEDREPEIDLSPQKGPKNFRCPKGQKQHPPKSKICVPKDKKGGANTSIQNGGSSIDPKQLTGKLGLDRMMNFVEKNSPPVKGEYEYKQSTLDNYGKIFSRDIVGKYSAKIKSILDNIVNPETSKVSEGIILIYSQYIDGGLIPMALALEEMGFTRFGQRGTKPLFKTRPTDIVDVRTMKAPTTEDKTSFIPARYAMITGDTKLSPDNDFEVKGLTNDNNKDGHKVKVVLISKAGSEGIDFKFIRQVHIIDPWYNMNRIEQIIGRAVRNFSHKDLPFEKRNVEIFMYGTILGDNVEEAADLYVYRVAEYKAIQIGKVTRVLKETSVDCIINHDQTNFTQEILRAHLKEPIKQELSTGLLLNDFKIGDAPFSPACDYMAECNYNCRPDKEIREDELNKDTYNENFIIMNSEKILQRIRMLMKEGFFYKKDVLIKSIQTPKEYPYVQIYAALTQLIEDANEFITDKYGRNGRLVNIGEYYLFQPVELRDKNASIFDRSVPIDYKHSMINFEIKQDIVKPVIDKRNLNNAIIGEEQISFPEGKRLVDEMKVNFDITREFSKIPKVPRGDDNWYKHCGIVIRKMSKDYPESKEHLISYIVAHMIELLLFEEKLDIMNYLYSLDSIQEGTFEWIAKEYFETNSITTKNFTAFVMYKLNKPMVMILDKDNKWIEAEPEDKREISASKEGKDFFTMKPNEYNKLVGFIGYEKSNRNLVYKIKDMTAKRDTGARCDEAGKVKTLQKLNEIVGETRYTNESTKVQKDADGNIISEAIGHTELCVLQEFLLRFFNTIKREDKKWFLTPELAIGYKLYTIHV